MNHRGRRHTALIVRVLITALSFTAYSLYDMNKNLLPQPTDVLDELSMGKEQKLLVNCDTFHSKYSTSNFAHVPSSVTGGSDFNMSVHDPEKEVISMEIKKHGCFECNILRPLISALKNSKNASLIV